ncbi:ABC-F family ATP-binding cassette domain-containing protein [Gymnodinialimonas sp. 2305UL16-5]|uniref:ABC-F family ATP-binding cassette domain-containing protein n=1 Tax=Gymnodinialimonas mytili TaxID=3126503 RepID=UPI0030954509
MPASITLSNLSLSSPDTSPLFTDLNVVFGPERVGIVGRNGIGKSTLLRMIAGEIAPTSGQINVSGHVALLRQEVSRSPDDTIADLFGVTAALACLDRAEAGRASLDDIANADWTLPARIDAALAQCDLPVPPNAPLAALSGGQRTRAALAALIFTEPDILLLDEPTNNLDQAGRAAVFNVLRNWSSGALVVSHDRALLDEMDAIVELTSLGATRYGGNYTAYRAQKQVELQAAEHALATAQKSQAEAARRAQQAAERKARKDAAGRRSRARGDQPKMLLDAAKARAEASGAAGIRLREARQQATDHALTEVRAQVEIIQPVRMEIPPSHLPQGKQVLRLDRVTGGYGNMPVICDLSLQVTGPERILLTGANGSGKTTLLRLLTGQLAPQTGQVTLSVPWALLDQYLRLLDPKGSLLGTFQRLNPTADTHQAHAALARFGFRADQAQILGGDLSGGERLRAGLACTLGATPTPQLLILDEPTNHLDLDGIAALETALKAYDGALLVVSHDAAFRRNLHWDRQIEL